MIITLQYKNSHEIEVNADASIYEAGVVRYGGNYFVFDSSASSIRYPTFVETELYEAY